MGKAGVPKTIEVYDDGHGKEPYTEWFSQLRDVAGRARIEGRLRHLEGGHYGDCHPVGEGVSELRMFFGPGYRVYFGEDPDDVIIVLCGGKKDTQKQDIKLAQRYWKEYQDHG